MGGRNNPPSTHPPRSLYFSSFLSYILSYLLSFLVPQLSHLSFLLSLVAYLHLISILYLPYLLINTDPSRLAFSRRS